MTKQTSITTNLGNMVNMTFDESAPLNQAYLKEIRAEDLTRMGKFDESTKYYYEAIGSTY